MRLYINALATLVIFGGALYLYGCDSASGVDSLEMDLTANDLPGIQSCTEWLGDPPDGLNRRCSGPIESPSCGYGVPGFTCTYRVGNQPVPPPGGGGGGETDPDGCYEDCDWTGECVGDPGEVASDCWDCSEECS